MSEESKRYLLEMPAPETLDEWCYQAILASFDPETPYESLLDLWNGVLDYIN